MACTETKAAPFSHRYKTVDGRFAKGNRGGPGRPKGSLDRRTREIAERAAQEGVTPLEYMLKILRDPDSSREDKMWAAEKAAPYCHPKLASVEHAGDVTFRHEDALKELE